MLLTLISGKTICIPKNCFEINVSDLLTVTVLVVFLFYILYNQRFQKKIRQKGVGEWENFLKVLF